VTSSVAVFEATTWVSMYDKIMIENQKKKTENMEIKHIFLHKSLSNRWFRNGTHSSPRRADATGSADIIHRM